MIRQSLIDATAIHLNGSANIGLIQGLTTGIRHNITAEQWQTLRLSGTSHLLSISGLHIGLASVIGFFARWTWSRRSTNLLQLPANEAGELGGFLVAMGQWDNGTMGQWDNGTMGQWDNVHFSILHPQTSDNVSENNLSCVLKISNQFGSVLLGG